MNGKIKIQGSMITLGGALLIFASILGFFSTIIMEMAMLANGSSWSLLNANPMPFYLNIFITFCLGISGLIGGVLTLKQRGAGHVLAFIIGLIAIIGLFLPVGLFTIPGIGTTRIYISTSLVYIDPILILMGGLLGLIFKQEGKKELEVNKNDEADAT